MKKPKSKSSPEEEPVSSVPAKPSAKDAAEKENHTGRLPLLIIGTLGVVFGDIGTSPLYALRECFRSEEGPRHLNAAPDNVLGVLSLITWSLIVIISIKYLLYVMRADNKGEGGILALLALIDRRHGAGFWFTTLSIFGAALLYGDGIITPAISVLSAVEGLKIATPIFQPYVVPIAIVILIGLFSVQRKGSAAVGKFFGPVMLIWFFVIAFLGVLAIVQEPHVLAALNPAHAFRFFGRAGWLGFTVLGAVFLVVTGGEALYADLGHFGRSPIRIAWFALVLPALLLNYFGQGALVLESRGEVAHPFFHLAPAWAMYPLVILATCAAIIASQAVICGVFSLTRQAVLLEQFPRVEILQTSGETLGQVYVPAMNWLLMLACIGLVVAFPSSSKLAGAYGVAVTTTMVITTILLATIARVLWKWNLAVVALVTAIFLIVDLAFFGANILKFIDGGWFPLLIGGLVFTVMTTWRRGRALLRKRLRAKSDSLDDFFDAVARKSSQRVPGTSVFMTGHETTAPAVLSHHLERNQVLTETVLLVRIKTHSIPHVPLDERTECEKLRLGFYRVRLHFGFMDEPEVPAALTHLGKSNEEIEKTVRTYYVGRSNVLPREKHPAMVRWREALFSFLIRNATQPYAFFHLPSDRVVELGIQIEI
ncbi:MAG: potassium transporter Kup [Verrucomicrobiota bacterium]|nr:potassium transporter Kup [Verrucomicrobiota bacterium]